MDGAVGLTPAHLLLREATRDAHEAAEATAGMRLLLAGELDESGYAGLLRAQLGLFREWEAERGGWLEALTEWRYVSRASLIKADLCTSRCGSRCGSRFSGDTARDNGTYLAATPFAAEAAPTIAAEAAPTGHSAAAWGELYVIEGSALGGRVIVRRLRELYPQLPHHFYAIGENAPASWRRFQSLLDHALPDEASQEAAVHAARRMFARFQQTLKDPAPHD
ncbi:heme oxygenase [Luteibacter sp. OK325]|uniref:biliverdin-producing heme oxygenase n=1 Tax=Luteibacter sp. OK325 TaxID=2135670 RepID=UPI000D394023|nr:biliverdin-producing heme oxygenase [Luteibacter sp. OK325]PTR26332.1 heme oxygenase [Luteibacter sp. OK325]